MPTLPYLKRKPLADVPTLIRQAASADAADLGPSLADAAARSPDLAGARREGSGPTGDTDPADLDG